MMIPIQFWLYQEQPEHYHVWVEMIDDSPLNRPSFFVDIMPANGITDAFQDDIPGPEVAAILYDTFMVVLSTIGYVERCSMQWRSPVPLNPTFGENDEAYLRSFVKNKGYTFVRGGGGNASSGSVDFESGREHDGNIRARTLPERGERDGR